MNECISQDCQCPVSQHGSSQKSSTKQERLVYYKCTNVSCAHQWKQMTHFIAHVEWESHHTEVVEYEDSFEVKSLAVLHYPRPQRCHKVNVCCDHKRLGEWGWHQEPVPCPWVCNRSMSTGLWDQHGSHVNYKTCHSRNWMLSDWSSRHSPAFWMNSS